MADILVNGTNPETKSFLVQWLETAGFEVLSTNNGRVSVQLEHERFSIPIESKESSSLQSIFPSIPRLRKVFDFIELNYHQNISLREVARDVGYSSAYLTVLVRRLTGKTVNTWIFERRIAEASNLLLETNYSIKEIALILGYQDISYFHRQFRDFYKQTPRAWREIQRCQIA